MSLTALTIVSIVIGLCLGVGGYIRGGGKARVWWSGAVFGVALALIVMLLPPIVGVVIAGFVGLVSLGQLMLP